MQFTDSVAQNVRRNIAIMLETMWLRLSLRMSARMFFLDFYVYPVLILLSTLAAFHAATYPQMLASTGLMCFGILCWTFAEYVLHRFVLHHVPYIAQSHQAHHDAPRELIGTPTWLSSIFFVVLIFLPVAAYAGLLVASAWFAGFLMGYLCYVGVHYAVHHNSGLGSVYLQSLKRQHARHHYGSSSHNFGVTTNFWDWVFRTIA